MKKRIFAAVLAAAVFFSTAVSGINVNAAEETSVDSGTTYYVSTLRGKDTNNGKSERTPFYSLRKINELTLQPGDKILLECGSVFKNGYLHLYGQSGSEEAPIVIDQYGTGADPIIDTNGQGVWYQNYGKSLDNSWHKYQGYVSSSILLYDSEYIEINNLEIVNKAPNIDTDYNAADTMNRTGVAAVAQDKGTIDHIHLKGLNIHDVIGNVYDKHMNNGGIYFTVFEPHNETETGISRYDNVRIEDCSVINTNRWGIAVGYTSKWDRFNNRQAIDDDDIKKYGSTDVVIRNNYVKDAGGDGITLMYCDRPLVEYNVSDGIGQQMHSGAYTAHGETQRFSAAIWPWKCKDAVFQYNEAFDTKNINGENGDGQAWDADWGDGTLYQYNYSHGNGGGCLMVCLDEAYRTTFRYNISQGDLKGILCIFGCPPAHIYNNVFYVEGDVPINREGKSGSAATLENNIFYYGGDQPSTDNSWNQGNNKTYSNNLFYNYANTPDDAAKVVVDKGSTVFVNAGSAPNNAVGAANLHNNPAVKSVFDGYKLAENSKAIGKGKAITDMHDMAASEVDFFGNVLKSGETPDIGVHQYQENEEPAAPPAPQKITVLNTEATSVTLQWPAAENILGITGYKIMDGDRVLMEITDPAAVTDPETGMITVTVSNLESGKQYSLSVVASDGSALSSPTGITFTTAAKDEGFIKAKEALDKAIKELEEKINAGEQNYSKEIWDEMLAVYNKLSNVVPGSSQKEIEDLTNEINTLLNKLNPVVKPDEKPVKLTAPAVSAVKAVAKKDGIKIQVTLNQSDNAASYRVYRTVGGKTTLAGTTTGTTFLDTVLYGGKQVTYTAEAVSGDTAKFTDSDKGETKNIKLAKAPGSFKVKKKSGKAAVSWKKVKSAKNYIVFRSEKKNGTYKKVATVKKNKTSYTDSKVKKKKTYYYKVAAKVGNTYTVMTTPKKVKIK